MKEIEIEGKKYKIDCSAFTYIKYASFFKIGMIEDLNYIKRYLVKQTLIAQKLEKEGKNEIEIYETITQMLEKDIAELTVKITQIAWIMIYTANESIMPYEKWLKTIKKFKLTDKWIVEVAEFAVSTFC